MIFLTNRVLKKLRPSARELVQMLWGQTKRSASKKDTKLAHVVYFFWPHKSKDFYAMLKKR